MYKDTLNILQLKKNKAEGKPKTGMNFPNKRLPSESWLVYIILSSF